MSTFRARDWKLLEYFEDQRIELYDLRDDLRERQDRATEPPDRAAKLRAGLHAWRAAVGAALPQPNPELRTTAERGN